MTRRLFGTDGIRGLVVAPQADEEEALLALHEQRVICPTLMRIVGEALGRTMDTLAGEGRTVVVGWDNRPNNTELAAALTLGLRLTGCHVIHAGLCATPALHRATLANSGRLGCMITASHNPVSDSGLKVFDANGFKSSPEFEDHVSAVTQALAAEEREIDDIEANELMQPNEALDGANDASVFHPAWLTQRHSDFCSLLGVEAFDASMLATPFVLDSSKGAAHAWLADWLTDQGIATIEVSSKAEALNLNCGAGDFSPTQTWTHEEAATSPHLLLQNLEPAPVGTLVGAALDGDGDRCLVLRATENGYMVIDGDAMGDTILSAATSNSDAPWVLAASIESDLSLLSTVDRLPAQVSTVETAVGDRWLSKALGKTLVTQSTPPRCIGVEDSGHIVMATRHPLASEKWALVGDGAATLTVFLLAFSCGHNDLHMNRGWKQRRSVKDVDRQRWSGSNELADEVEALALGFFERCGDVNSWDRHGLDGESNLMLVSFTLNGSPASLGIRNSGTQAKISVSLRLAPDIDASQVEALMDAITVHLSSAMRI
jgi:phosphoglucosamine mutase